MNEMELLACARKLRDFGYALVVLSPEELEGLRPDDVESELVIHFQNMIPIEE